MPNERLPFEADPSFAEAVERLAHALAAHSGTPAEQVTIESIRAGVRRGAAEAGYTPEAAALYEQTLLERAKARALEIVAERIATGLAVFKPPAGTA